MKPSKQWASDHNPGPPKGLLKFTLEDYDYAIRDYCLFAANAETTKHTPHTKNGMTTMASIFLIFALLLAVRWITKVHRAQG